MEITLGQQTGIIMSGRSPHRYTVCTVTTLTDMQGHQKNIFVVSHIQRIMVANPKKILFTVAGPDRGLLNREKRTKEKIWQRSPPHPPRCSFGEEEKKHVTHLQALHRFQSVCHFPILRAQRR